MRYFLILSVSLLLVGADRSAPPLQEGPAAVVVKVEGTVQIETPDGTAAPASVGDRLELGSRVLPESGSRAVLVSRTGATRTVTEPIALEAAEGGGDGDLFSRTVRVLAQAANTDARSQPNRQGMIRPIPGQAVAISPRNEIAVRSTQPTLQWHGVEGAESYTVQIRRPGDAPVRFSQIGDTVWTLPASEEALRPGEVYLWTVAPDGSGRAAPEERFQVLDRGSQEWVDGELTSLRETGLDPDGEGLVLAAALYREAGLHYDALDALERLEASGDPLSPEVYFLKGEVLDALGRLEEAGRAFDEAEKRSR